MSKSNIMSGMQSNQNLYHKIKFLLTRNELRFLIGIFVLMLITALFELLSIGLVIPVLTLLSQESFYNNQPEIEYFLNLVGNPQKELIVVYTMLTFFLVYCVKNFLVYLFISMQARFTYNVETRLSKKVFENYLFQPYSFHLIRNSSELLRNITGEVHLFASYGVAPSLVILSETIILIGVSILLILAEPVISISVVITFGTVIYLIQNYTRQKNITWGKKRQFHEGKKIQQIQQGINGIKDLKILGREEEVIEEFSSHNRISASASRYQNIIQQTPRLFIELIVVSVLTGLVTFMVLRGELLENIIPILGLFAVAAFRLMPSSVRITNSLQSLRYAIPVINNLYNEVVLTETQNCIQTQVDNRICYKKQIKIKNVCFSYENKDDYAIKDISLMIKQGESIGIIGSSGSGKSTLIDIILGLHVPSSGRITVDDIDICNNIRSWQDNIGYVPQSIYLTDDKLFKNIAFGVKEEEVDFSKVDKALELAQLDKFVERLPEGISTMVGENGTRLSGGQRQRIGIARALYHDPELLVLDEATSALDQKIEKDVMESVYALKRKKTIIIVAHRQSTIQNCDKVIHIESGEIVNFGLPSEILTAV